MRHLIRATITTATMAALVVGGALAGTQGALSAAAAAEPCGVPQPAEDFTPTVEFGLSDAAPGANPEVNIKVSQDSEEQELGHITMCVPAGFTLPKDAKIENDTEIGSADITIDVGPRCADAGPASGPVPINDNVISELDRTDEQADQGVKAVWEVDIRGVSRIVLEITGSKKVGYKLDGDIPANQFTCPPLAFDGVIFATAGEVPIFKNPPAACPAKLTKGKKCLMPFGPGDYLFAAFMNTQESDATALVEQTITITE